MGGSSPSSNREPRARGRQARVRSDRQTGTTERVSVDSAGNEGNDLSAPGAISPDGRFVVLFSRATNLVPGDTNGSFDVFVRDLQAGTTERVSVANSGGQANSSSSVAGSTVISADGRFVAFGSVATNLVTGDTNGSTDVFVRDRQAGTTQRVSVNSAGIQGNNLSDQPALSADGSLVFFQSASSNLVSGDTNDAYDVFMHELATPGADPETLMATESRTRSKGPWARRRTRSPTPPAPRASSSSTVPASPWP